MEQKLKNLSAQLAKSQASEDHLQKQLKAVVVRLHKAEQTITDMSEIVDATKDGARVADVGDVEVAAALERGARRRPRHGHVDARRLERVVRLAMRLRERALGGGGVPRAAGARGSEQRRRRLGGAAAGWTGRPGILDVFFAPV